MYEGMDEPLAWQRAGWYRAALSLEREGMPVPYSHAVGGVYPIGRNGNEGR